MGDHTSVYSKWGAKGQKLSDPLAWLLGDKYVDFVSKKIPEATNRIGSQIMKPFEKVDKAINPIRKIPIVNEAGDEIAKKPGDAIGTVIGAVAGGGALMGMGAGGGAGVAGGAGGGAAGAGTGAGAGAGGAASGGGGGASAAGMSKWGRLLNMGGQSMQQQRPPEPIDVVDPLSPEFDTTLQDPYMVSSKKVKLKRMGGDEPVGDINDPIDRNGIEILSIQTLSERIDEAAKTLAALKKGKAQA